MKEYLSITLCPFAIVVAVGGEAVESARSKRIAD
jgi:hypothetical protein